MDTISEWKTGKRPGLRPDCLPPCLLLRPSSSRNRSGQLQVYRKGSNLMIGKIQRVPLREVWKHEALDLTKWLQDNIEVLNEPLDLSLSNAEREQSAGDFNVDLVAEEEGGGLVVIENQLEKSDHAHLGKLITYLTAIGAKKAVWIVAEPRPEHVAAITWLNEGSAAAFYLLKIEGIRIGDSDPAPLLTLIVGP